MKSQRLLALSLIVLASTGIALLAERWGGVTGVTQLENTTLDWRQTTTPESFQAGRGTRQGDIVLVLFDRFSVTDSVVGCRWSAVHHA